MYHRCREAESVQRVNEVFYTICTLKIIHYTLHSLVSILFLVFILLNKARHCGLLGVFFLECSLSDSRGQKEDEKK